MRFMKTTAVGLALAVGGLSVPTSSLLMVTNAVAAEKVVKKKVVRKSNGNRVTTKRVVVRRSGVRAVNGRYYYGGRYYDENEALAAGLIGFTAGAILGGALGQPQYLAEPPY
jgi:hypothetical protein